VKGADQGPQAIIDASDSIELYDIELDAEGYREGIYTDVPIRQNKTPEEMVQAVFERVSHFVKSNKIVGVLGGEHSVSIGSIQAMKAQFPNLSVLQIDAHADLRDSYQNSPYNHACVMRRAQEMGANVVQVGIRNVGAEEKPFIVPENMFYAHQIRHRSNWMEEALHRLPGEVYLSIDLDGLDPSILPSTGTPLPGGLSWYPVDRFFNATFSN
jgi:agmatinase